MNTQKLLSLMVISVFLSGCAVAAAPCRVTGAVVKVIPIIGDAAGAALDACGDIID
jgi:hypothetical protein